MSRGAAPDLLDGVPEGFEEDDVDLVEEDTGQQAETGREDGDDLHGWNELPVGAKISRNERDPHDEEDQHAESDELGFCEVLRKFSWFKGKEETNGCQQAGVANEKPKSHHWSLVTSDKYHFINVVVSVARRRGIIEPDHTDHDLDEGAKKHQEKLEVQPPPFTMKTGGDLGLEHQKHSVGLHQDAGDAENEADSEGRLA